VEEPAPPRPAAPSRAPVAVTATVLVCAWAALFWHQSARAPYSRDWDMDLAVAEDTLWIQSGRLPHVVGHPGFGMNLLLVEAQRLGAWLGLLSIRTFADLERCLSPLSALAEWTDFCRRASPILAAAVALVLWRALVRLAAPQPAFGLLALLAFLCQPSLLFQAAFVRSELYAIFYWSLAVYGLAVARTTRAPRTRIAAWFGTGLALGLSYATKVQVLFFLLTFPALALLPWPETAASSDPDPSPHPWSHGVRIGAAAGALLVFVSLLVASGRADVPPEVWTYAMASFRLQPVAIALAAVLALALAIAIAESAGWAGPRRAGASSPVLAAFALGAIVALALHSLLYADPRVSWRYLLVDAKVLFWRSLGGLAEPWRDRRVLFSALVQTIPTAFVVAIAALAASMAATWHDGPSRWRRFAPALALVAGALANAFFASRFVARDMGIVEPLMTFASLSLVGLLAASSRRRARLAAWGLGLALLLGQLGTTAAMADVTAHVDSQRGYQDEPWLERSWAHSELDELMARRYGSLAPEAVRAARAVALRHDEARRTAGFVLPAQFVDHRRIGVLAAGLPVWTDDPEWRLASFPARLLGALVVDAVSAPFRKTALPVRPWELGTRERAVLPPLPPKDGFASLIAGAAERRMVLSPRSNLEVLLFLRADDLGTLADNRDLGGYDRMVVAADGRERVLYGLPIERDTAVAAERLRFRALVVIRDELFRPGEGPRPQ
jgi:hypothetical protein